MRSSPAAARLLALTLVSLLAGCHVAAQEETCTGPERRILIVGAGIAGASAAYNLSISDPCFKVTVLEGRNRVGGRMNTREAELPGLGLVRAEMGAQWIEGTDGNPIYELAVKYGLKIGQQNGDVLTYTVYGEQYTDKELAAAEALYQDLMAKAAKYALTLEEDISVQEAVKKVNKTLYDQPFVQARLSQDFEFTHGSLWDLSARYYDSGGFEGEQVLVTNGYDKIPKYIMRDAQAAGTELVLNFNVTKIQVNATGVTVTGVHANGTEGTYDGEAVIVTLPLGVLKAGVVEFVPPLSDRKLGAVERVGFGFVSKLVMWFKKCFWDLSSDEYLIEEYSWRVPRQRGRFPNWRSLASPENMNALMGIALGKYAENMHRKTPRAVAADAGNKMAAMFPAAWNKSNRPVDLWVKDWGQDPFARGCYSYAKVGIRGDGNRPTDFDILAEPENERVLFGGEHTIENYRGTVHGAYYSGIREAQRIIASFARP